MALILMVLSLLFCIYHPKENAFKNHKAVFIDFAWFPGKNRIGDAGSGIEDQGSIIATKRTVSVFVIFRLHQSVTAINEIKQ